MLKSFLVSLNTHAVANRGLLIAGVALAVKIAADVAAANMPAGSALRIALADADTFFATPAIAGGALAAYYGRPKTV